MQSRTSEGLDKFYLVAGGITTKAMESICFGVNTAAWFIIFVERAFCVIGFIRFDIVMLQNRKYRKPLFYVAYFHDEKSCLIIIS